MRILRYQQLKSEKGIPFSREHIRLLSEPTSVIGVVLTRRVSSASAELVYRNVKQCIGCRNTMSDTRLLARAR